MEAKIENGKVTIKGPKGELSRNVSSGVSVKQADNAIRVERSSDEPDIRALHGLTRSLINNMVIGVSEGFEKKLELVGVGYRANKKGNSLEILVGFSKPVSVEKPDGIEFEVEANTKLSVKGIDKELVGQVASDIRAIRPPEPYKGKGIRYADEHVRRKAGKAAKATGAE